MKSRIRKLVSGRVREETPAAPRREYSLRLYVTGTTRRSLRAVTAIKKLCEEKLRGNYDLQVIDIYQHPARAIEDQIVAAPTLVREAPIPKRCLIGDLTDSARLLAALNLKAA